MKAKNIIAIVVGIAVIVMAAIVSACGVQTEATFWALVPPIVAIGLALITKEVYSSLFVGIVVGGIFASGGSVTKAVDNVVSEGLIEAISGTAGIFLFLVILGIIVALINKCGGAAAFGRWAATHIKSRIGAQLATFVLGVLIFIDDYFNCLTVGSVMMPLTDANRISRAKFSYLIDATAAPICMIAPISSWAAAVASYVGDTKLDGMGMEIFVQAIPYNFYSLLTFVFIIGIVLLKADFGPMRKHELNAINNGDLFSTDERVDGMQVEDNARGSVADLLVPIVLLIVASVVALIYCGGFFGVDLWGGTDYAGDFIGAFSNTDATVALPWGGLIALILIMVYLMVRRLINFKEIMECVPKGFIAMVPAITILTLATALKNMSNGLLSASGYVEMLMMSETAANLSGLLPAVIFVVACLLAFATGTSWGTFGILIPIVAGIFEVTDPMMCICISACLAGAVCGDHCSPISDTTIMSSAGARCVHILHVSTQLPYAIAVAAISLVCYLLAGFVHNAVVCLLVGAVLTIGLLLVVRFVNNKKAAKA